MHKPVGRMVVDQADPATPTCQSYRSWFVSDFLRTATEPQEDDEECRKDPPKTLPLITANTTQIFPEHQPAGRASRPWLKFCVGCSKGLPADVEILSIPLLSSEGKQFSGAGPVRTLRSFLRFPGTLFWRPNSTVAMSARQHSKAGLPRSRTHHRHDARRRLVKMRLPPISAVLPR